MPGPVGRAARAVNRRAVRAAADLAADVVPALAQKAVSDAVARLSGIARKARPRAVRR
jgi:hypothetical protein